MLLQTSRQGLPWHKAAGRGRSRLKGPRRPFKSRALAQTCTKYGRKGEGRCLARRGLGKGDALGLMRCILATSAGHQL